MREMKMDRTPAARQPSYNPGFLSDGDLRDMFCVRVHQFASILETVRGNTGPSSQHVMVLGPRGSGKTTLLLRVAAEIRADPELSARFYPIILAEESYTVGTCGEFWLECLSRLADQVRRDTGNTDLCVSVAELGRERDDRTLRYRCLGRLLDFADQEQRRLVIGAENLDMLFSDIGDPYVGWCLRATLQNDPEITLIGTATRSFGEIERIDRAMFEFFRVLWLRPLTRAESAALCETVAGEPIQAGTSRRLQILTGGSPRSLAIMARFAAVRSFRAPLDDLLEVVDQHTAYFKGHLESLPAQERRVYLALVELWRPATAREVAERARISTSACSAQLRRLMGRGLVSGAGGTRRRKEYAVSERLFAFYYLLRRSRGTDASVRALAEFMDAYYAPPSSETSPVADIGAGLAALGESDALPRDLIDALLAASVTLGTEEVVALIGESPSADRLLPLTTALELEMGLEPKVAIEVREVADDLRRDLARLPGR